jgi:hypothetical protein
MVECGDAKSCVKIFAMIGVCDRRKSIVWWGLIPVMDPDLSEWNGRKKRIRRKIPAKAN